MKTVGYRSPGRRAMASQLGPKSLHDAKRPFHFYRGQYPQVVAEDRHFGKMFQEWKNNGGLEDDPLVDLLRARWNELTKTGEA